MRLASIVLAMVATVLPAGWAHVTATSLKSRACSDGVHICGWATIEIALIAALTAALISTAAVVCSIVAFRRLPYPRPSIRRLEVLAVSLPLVLTVVFVSFYFLVFVAGIGLVIA